MNDKKTIMIKEKEKQIVKAMEIVKNKIEKHKDVFIRLKDK